MHKFLSVLILATGLTGVAFAENGIGLSVLADTQSNEPGSASSYGGSGVLLAAKFDLASDTTILEPVVLLALDV